MSSSIGVMLPMSLPLLVTRRPTIVLGPPSSEPAVASSDVVARTKAPVGHFHHACLGVRGRRPGLFLALLAKSLDRANGSFDAPLIVERGGNSRLPLSLRRFRIRVREHRLHVQCSLLATLEKRRFTTEGGCRCAGPDTCSVLRHALEREQALVQQDPQHFGESVFSENRRVWETLNRATSYTIDLTAKASDPRKKMFSTDGTATLEEGESEKGSVIPLSTANQEDVTDIFLR